MTKSNQPTSSRPVQIPVEGALGILALGASGLRAWREVKAAAEKAGAGNKKSEIDNNTKGE